jgi:hypothetical protein
MATSANPFDVKSGISGGVMTDATDTKAAQYTAQEREVQPGTQTAAGQLETILAKDSPLMQRARTQATQDMAKRGLINSSMAAGAGVAAMIDRATPIAQQDAETYSNRAVANMGAVNQAGLTNVGEQNKFGLQLGEQKFTAGESATQRQFQTGERLGSQTFTSEQNKATQDFQSAQSQLDRAQQVALADKSIEAQKALQNAQQVFQGAQSELDRVNQKALQEGQQNFQRGENTLDRTQQVTILQAQQDFSSAQSALDRAQQITLTDKSIAANQALETARQNFQTAQNTLDRAQQSSLAQMQVTATKDLETARQTFSAAQSQLDRDQQTAITKLANSLNEANVSKTFAANLALSSSSQVAALAADPNLTPDAKKIAIQNVVDNANSTMQWGSTFYNTPLPTIAGPGGTASTVNSGGTYAPTTSSASSKPAWQEYLDANPDVAREFGYSQEGAIAHYRNYGNRETRAGVTDAFKALL